MNTTKKQSSVSKYLETIGKVAVCASAPPNAFSEESRSNATHKCNRSKPARKIGSFVG